MVEPLTTVRDVVSALGGVAATAELFACSEQAVFAWIKADRFPAKLYLAIRDRLRVIGAEAADALFGMVTPPPFAVEPARPSA